MGRARYIGIVGDRGAADAGGNEIGIVEAKYFFWNIYTIIKIICMGILSQAKM